MPAEGEGKASGAAQAALDAMEQLVNTLAHGKEEILVQFEYIYIYIYITYITYIIYII